ncbi:hypothetical protein [Streptomyces sp. NBC_01565]|uniref:terpene synthase family protein n=1 Tax=unclassified Streptomyces TaxID=2593676 RepID=UPI00224F6D8C|nr:hypothetical protein [Streptomyces sp. NBC_01565]MCX4546942.1 hypothetical protein [Streptomyces sp. NBC_01565]
MGFFFVFDDQFDGPLGRDPARAAAVCRQLIDIVHGAALGPGADGCSRTFADLWAHSRERAHLGWMARCAAGVGVLLRRPGPRGDRAPARDTRGHGGLSAGPPRHRRHRPAALPR